ncbi:MAG: hypothetical protein AB4372_29370 [Xenococcus sp. (in: cyanobacteria)]
MLTINYPRLTREQIELIPVYRHKWQQIACSTEIIDREQARLAINKAYEFIDLAEPNIIFFSNPYEALDYIHSEVKNSWGKLGNTSLSNPIGGKLNGKLLGGLKNQIKGEILKQLQGKLDKGAADNIASEIGMKIQENNLFSIIWAHVGELARISSQNSDVNYIQKFIFNIFFEAGFIFNSYISFPLWQTQRQISNLFSNQVQAENNMNQMFSVLLTGNFQNKNKAQYQLPSVEVSGYVMNVIVPSVMADFAYYIDYFNSVLNCYLDKNKWNIFYNLITYCGWIFPYEKTAIVCQRPIRINLDRDSNSEQQKEVIIEFSDHFKIYDNY